MTAANSHDESPVDTPPRRQRWFVGLLCAVVFLSLYVLSAGPMVAINRKAKFEPLERIVETVYAPLVFIVRRDIRPISTGLKWYAGLFR